MTLCSMSNPMCYLRAKVWRSHLHFKAVKLAEDGTLQKMEITKLPRWIVSACDSTLIGPLVEFLSA